MADEASFCRNDTLFTLQPIPFGEGELATPRPYSVRHDDVLTLLLVLCATVYLVAIGSSLRTIKNMAKEFFYPSASAADETLFRITPLMLLFAAMACITMAVPSFVFAAQQLEGRFVIDSSIAIVAIFFAAFVAYNLLKWVLYGIVNNVLFGSKKSLQWEQVFFFLIALEGVMLFPLWLGLAYFGLSVESAIYYVVFVLFLNKILTFYKSRSIFFKGKSLFLQNILYFCTLEIMPLLALSGAWLILAHSLKVIF